MLHFIMLSRTKERNLPINCGVHTGFAWNSWRQKLCQQQRLFLLQIVEKARCFYLNEVQQKSGNALTCSDANPSFFIVCDLRKLFAFSLI
jgi:hypothetical protein